MWLSDNSKHEMYENALSHVKASCLVGTIWCENEDPKVIQIELLLIWKGLSPFCC